LKYLIPHFSEYYCSSYHENKSAQRLHRGEGPEKPEAIFERKERLQPTLWVGISEERFTATALRSMLRRRAGRAGVPVPSPHDFRRAFALERWRAGVDILTLSKLMGHTSLQVLNRYFKQAGEDLEPAARQSTPVDLHF